MDYTQEKYKVFDMFNCGWALASAGNMEDFDGCTIGWGSLGDIWGGIDHGKMIATIYVNPIRYTCEYLMSNDYFTVSFFPDEYKKDLGILGSRSGRDFNKFGMTRLTPYALGESVAFEEASLTFLCRKLYWNQFDRTHMTPDVAEIYASPDFPPHYEFIGEIVDVVSDGRDRK